MSAILALAAAVSATPPSLRLVDTPSIALGGPIVRIGDVVAVDRLARWVRARIAPMVIARLPAHHGTYAMDRSAIIRLLRRRLPGSTISGPPGGIITFKMPKAGGVATTGTGCFALSRAIAAGGTIAAGAIIPARCVGRSRAATRFDRGRQQVIATEALPIGTGLGRLSVRPAPLVEKGEALRLVSRVGPVRIERTVTALQSSAAGRVYVRDSDGHVFSARYGKTGETR